jgi:hypothetical protein
MLIITVLVVALALALAARRRAGRAEREQMAARLDQLAL